MPLVDPPAALRLHARPALVVAGAVGIGVAVETHLSVGLAGWCVLVALAAAVPVVASIATGRRLVTTLPLAWAAAGCIAALALGGARMAAWRTLPPDDVSVLVARALAADSMDGSLEVTLQGRLVAPPARVASGARVRVAVEWVATESNAGPVTGLVEATLARDRYGRPPSGALPNLQLGDRVELDGRLRAPPGRRNPDDFDYARYLGHHGVGATLRVVGADGVRALGPGPSRVVAAVAAVQARVREAVHRHVRHEEARSVALALLIADRSALDPETREAFARTGLTHLLAVSGLHVLLVGLVLYHLLRPTLARLRLGWRAVEVTRAAVTLAILSLYALVTGGSPSVVRAVVMAGAMVSARALQRPTDALNGLGAAALLLLLWRPAALFEAGFQLSFAAVAALVTISPVLMLALPSAISARRGLRPVVSSLVASTAATLGTAPVLAFHFGQVPLGGLVLNVPAIPVTNVALGAGLAMALSAGPAPAAADAFGAIAELATAALLTINDVGVRLFEWSVLEGFVARPTTVLGMVAFLVAAATWRRPASRWRALAAGTAFLAAGPWASVAAGDGRPRVDVLFLDVGQGDATLVSLPGHRHLLVDAGPRDDAWDAGARIVVPQLRRRGVRELEALVITHPHADHFGGMEAILRSTHVRRILTNGQAADNPAYARALRVADSLGVPIDTVRAGDVIDLGASVRARVLSPRDVPAPDTDPNDGSIVLLLQYGRTSMLLTGDAQAGAEWVMAARYGTAMRADVVKVGHHGSRTSSTPPFVSSAARPGCLAVLQVARRNRYGLPDEEPLERWRRAGCHVATTSSSGAVWLRSNGVGFERIPWRD